MNYTLFNESTKKRLELPRTGLWYTSDLEEAREMQKAARNYLKSVGLRGIIQYVRVINADTDEIVF